ncbi:MAG: class B sortase [Clostridia bacterium]|nr:class B sortase [Clostridia bacterium]
MKHSKNNFDEPARVIKRDNAPAETVYALTFSEAVSNYFNSRFSKENFRRFIKDSFPQKDDSTREKVRKTVMDVSFVLLVLGLAYMVFYYFSYRERIADLKNWEISVESFDEDELFDFEIEKLWQDIKEQYPDVDFPEGMSIKFASLYAVNQDVVGILNIPGNGIWTPLLLNKTHPMYYLRKDLYGEYNRYGNPYVDYECNMDKGKLSKNTIIYGHNTHDKLGFNKLTNYMKLAGYKQAPVIELETLYEKTQWKIFGVMLTNSTSAADRGHLFNYLITDFSSNDQFMTVIKGIAERSMIKTDVDVKASDKILTLYTCYQDIFDGGRLVVFARLVREGESAEVDVSKAKFNHNARYPQAYYDQLGLKNPYEALTQPIIYETNENGEIIGEMTDSPFADDDPSATVENTTLPVNQETTLAPTVTEPEGTTAVSAVPENTTAAPPAADTTAGSQVPETTAPAPVLPENTTAAPQVNTTAPAAPPSTAPASPPPTAPAAPAETSPAAPAA